MYAMLLCLLVGQTFEVNGNDDVAINAQVARAVAAGGGVVHLPGGRYTLNGPVLLNNCSNVTLKGDGPTTQIVSGGYCGQFVEVGLSGEAATRTDSPLTPGKASVRTGGKAALAITGHPFQLGWCTDQGAGQPDYWGGNSPITWDVALSFPTPPADGAAVCGFSTNGAAENFFLPAPWLIRWVNGALVLDLKCAGDVQFHRLIIPVPAGPPFWRVSAQYDPASGRVAAWVGGKLVASAFAQGWDSGRPAGPLEKHNGVTPFMVGYAGPRMDGGVKPGGITDLDLHAFRIARGRVYQWGDKQTFAVQPDRAIDDNGQFYSGGAEVLPGRSLVALMLMGPEAPGTAGVSCYTYRGRGLLSWVTPIGWWKTVNVAIEDLTIAGATQPCILVGAVGRLALRRLTCSGASQAVGSMPLMVSYPIVIDDCDLSGWDSPIVSFWQMIDSRNLVLSGCGRSGIRTVGGSCNWDGVKVWRLSPYCESVFRHTGSDDGLSQVYRNVVVDNEEGNDPSVAFVDVTQGAPQRGRLKIEGFDASATPAGVPLIRLTGVGNAAPYRVDAAGLNSFGTCPLALKVDGAPGKWHGAVDTSTLYPAAVQGDLAAIAVTPPTRLYKPPAPAPPPVAP